MKKVTNQTRIIMSILLIAALAVTAVPIHSLAKAKVKLNKTKLSMNVGKTASLKLKNNKKKVKWSSSNKKVAKVSAKGKVKGLKKGKATITAKVGKKKYKCKVTVKARKEAEATKKSSPMPKSTAAATNKPVPKPTEIPIATPDITPTATPTQRPTETPVPKLEYIYFEEQIEDVELKLGEEIYLTVKPYPKEAEIPTKIRWEVSDPDAVGFWFGETQDEYGFKHHNGALDWCEAWVKAELGDYGTATFTAWVDDLSVSCKVTVPPIEAELELSEDGTVLKDCKNANSATVINIPNTVTRIAGGSIGSCVRVKSLEIPSSVTTISYCALAMKYGLSMSLKSLYIPSSVTKIEEQPLPESCIIYGESGSYAEQWAKENSYTFVVR